MQTSQPLPRNNEPTSAEIAHGFRIDRLELLRWGTFDGDGIHVVEFDGQSSCMTGPNRGGKSTLIDALITLLVPSDSRSYNVAASGEGKKRDRSLRTYIRGAYGKKEAADGGGSSVFLRDPGVVTALLATFTDAFFGKSVTLAQLHWLNASGEPEGRYLIIDEDVGIADMKLHEMSVGRLKDHFTKLRWRVETTFAAYQGLFCEALRIPRPNPERALDLLCRTVYLKDVDDVNKFVRELMLDPPTVQQDLDGLRKHYGDLKQSHDEIIRIEKDIRMLDPVATAFNSYTQAQKEAARLTDVRTAGTVFFSRKYAELLDLEIDRLSGLIESAGVQVEVAREKKKLADRAFILAESRLNDNETQKTVAQLRTQVDTLNATRHQRKERNGSYHALLELTGHQGRVENEQTFNQRREWAATTLRNAEENRTAAHRDFFALEADVARRDREMKGREIEILELEGRQDKIPALHRAVRDKIASALGLSALDLPFAGEMIDVKKEEHAWRSSIEVLLHGFALSMLVKPEHYNQVSLYIDRNDFGRRLTYFKARTGTGVVFGGDSKKVYGKIEVKAGAWAANWVTSHVCDHFDHVCAETPQELWQHSRAISKNLHVRYSNERHSRESAASHVDYDILGWSNKEKVERLKLAFAADKKILSDDRTRLQELGRRRSRMENEQLVLNRLSDFKAFVEIDFASLDPDILELGIRITNLEQADDALRAMKAEVAEAKQAATEADQQFEAIVKMKSGHETQLDNVQKRRGKAADAINAAAVRDFDWSVHVPEVLKFAGEKDVSLENVAAAQSVADRRIGTAIGKQNELAGTASADFAGVAQAFLSENKDRGYASDVSAKVEFGSWFVDLRDRLVGEELHTEKERFANLMRTKLFEHVFDYYAKLRQNVKEVKDEITRLNGTLATIDYNPGTVVQIHHTDSADKNVANFTTRLKACLTNTVGATEAERMGAFGALEELIRYIDENKVAAEMGADPTRWLNFAVEEVLAEDHKVRRDYVPGGGGGSGGQKAKLAFTILAAALCYRMHHSQSKDSNAFRLVMIDEMFAKSDDMNSRQALDVFEKFDFQLVLVSPLDGKVRLVVKNVGSYHLVTNPTYRNSSITPITVVEFERHQRKGAVQPDA